MIYTAFILGLGSSLHCIGMCGPIAFMLPVNKNGGARKAMQLVSYHLGRIATYSLLGLLFGTMGRGLYLSGMQQQLSVLLGLALIFIALVPEKNWLAAFSNPGFGIASAVRSALGKRLHNGTYSSLFVLGTLNGLLPCGLVYGALFGSMATQQTGYGTLYMAVFGLGTVPLMASVNYSANLLPPALRQKLRHALPLIGISIGVLFIARGLGLGIPYVSPSEMSLLVKSAPDCH